MMAGFSSTSLGKFFSTPERRIVAVIAVIAIFLALRAKLAGGSLFGSHASATPPAPVDTGSGSGIIIDPGSGGGGVFGGGNGGGSGGGSGGGPPPPPPPPTQQHQWVTVGTTPGVPATTTKMQLAQMYNTTTAALDALNSSFNLASYNNNLSGNLKGLVIQIY